MLRKLGAASGFGLQPPSWKQRDTSHGGQSDNHRKLRHVWRSVHFGENTWPSGWWKLLLTIWRTLLKVEPSCCRVDQKISSVLVCDGKSHPVWWNHRKSEVLWETSGCKSGDLPTRNLPFTKIYWHLLEKIKKRRTGNCSAALNVCNIISLFPNARCSLRALKAHMVRDTWRIWTCSRCDTPGLVFFSIHREKWLRPCLSVEHAGHHRASGVWVRCSKKASLLETSFTVKLDYNGLRFIGHLMGKQCGVIDVGNKIVTGQFYSIFKVVCIWN